MTDKPLPESSGAFWFGIDWASGQSTIALQCPVERGRYSVSLYVEWADVPDPWPCTCGAMHAKPKPSHSGVVTDGN
jgi:hypothetical protein